MAEELKILGIKRNNDSMQIESKNLKTLIKLLWMTNNNHRLQFGLSYDQFRLGWRSYVRLEL